MGNPDLAVIINKTLYIIRGPDYQDRAEAIQIAIKRMNDYNNEIEKMRQQNWKVADPSWFPEDIETIQIYTI